MIGDGNGHFDGGAGSRKLGGIFVGDIRQNNSVKMI
jgi:hypothetical protein